MTWTRTKVATEDAPRAISPPMVTRATILAPYLERLGIGGGAEGNARELPAIIDAGDYILELDDWERMIIRVHASGTDVKGRPWPSLVTEGLAFQLRCLERMAVLDGAAVDTPDQLAHLTGHLIIDGAIGITLLDDLRWAINRLIREGQVGVAGRLTGFRNAVNQNISRVRSYVDPGTFTRTESAADEMSGGHIQHNWPEIPAGEDDEEPPPKPARNRRRPSPPKVRRKTVTAPELPRPAEESSSSRLLSLTIVLIVSGMLWSFLMPRGADSESPPTLTREEFAEIPSISEVEARPPSLYVTFNTTEWREMGELKRWRALERVGTIATVAGYTGAHMRTSDGETVGRWSKRLGAKAVNNPIGRGPS